MQSTTPLTQYDLLLGTFSSQLTRRELVNVKKSLEGHVAKEKVQQIRYGKELFDILRNCGLISETKFAFLKKIFKDSGLDRHLLLLDEYLERNRMKKERKIKHTDASFEKRLTELDAIEQRQATALYLQEEKLKNQEGDLLEKQIAKDSIKRAIEQEDENIMKMHQKMAEKQDELKASVSRCEEIKMMKAEENEDLKKIMLEIQDKESQIIALKGTEKSAQGRRKSAFTVTLDRDNITKLKKQIEKLWKEAKSKEKDLESYDYKLEHYATRKEQKEDRIRHLEQDVTKKVKRAMSLEGDLIGAIDSILEAKQRVSETEMEILELKEAIYDTRAEREATICNRTYGNDGDQAKAIQKINERLQGSSSQIKDYSKIILCDSYTFGSKGSRMKPLQINCPTAIGINIAGQIIIADSRNHRLLITDIFGEPVKESVELGLFKPIDLTIDNNNDRIIVIDSSLIKLFDKDGVFQFQILPVLTNRDLLPKLTGVTVDENGDIFVCDSSNKRLQRFKEDGTFQDFLDFQSTIQHPDRILDIGSHEVIVSDVSESTLYIVNTLKNTFYEIRSIGREGICPGEFVRPRGLARDQNGSIAVADSDNHRVQLVTTDGRCQGSIGRLGSSPGCLDHPSDVAIHPKGFVVVADTRNNRIVVYN